MEFTNYISDLLYRYECIIIPEFGAFLTQRYSAEIDEGKGVFLPPRKVISFNEQLKQNDGLLANHIVAVDHTSYEVAVEKIASYVTTVKSKLVEGETVLFLKLGYFSLCNEGKLQFSPLMDTNYLMSSFGLQPTYKTPVLREVYKKEVEVLEDKTQITLIPETRAKSKHSYLKYAAIAVVALGLSAVLGKGYNTKMEDVTSHNEKVPSEIDRQAYQKASFFEVSPIEVPEVTFNVTVEKKNIGKYHIIAGAFRFEENADNKVTQLKEDGFSARSIGQNKYGLHQVVYTSVIDKAEAISTLKTIKKIHNSNAWLLVKEID
jgi:cell division septation protein DedD